jgi:TRAP-type C4-dicarboxylate transport system permease small subunit
MERLFRAIRHVEEFILAWSILGIALLTVANVLSRSLLGFSLAFAEELSQFLIIAVTFTGLSYAAGRGRHIRMTAIFDQLPRRGRKVLVVIISATTSLLLLGLAVYAVEYVATVRFLGTVSPVLRVPLFLVYAIVPLGLLLAALQYGLTTVRNLTTSQVFLSFDQRGGYADADSVAPMDSGQSQAGPAPITPSRAPSRGQ